MNFHDLQQGHPGTQDVLEASLAQFFRWELKISMTQRWMWFSHFRTSWRFGCVEAPPDVWQLTENWLQLQGFDIKLIRGDYLQQLDEQGRRWPRRQEVEKAGGGRLFLFYLFLVWQGLSWLSGLNSTFPWIVHLCCLPQICNGAGVVCAIL